MRRAADRFDLSVRRRPENHPNQVQLTPEYVLSPVRLSLGGVIELDPCTEPDNPVGATTFYALPDDGCEKPWDAQTVYVNPPYGEARVRWVEKCIRVSRGGARIVLLIPSATDTLTYQRALSACTTAIFVAGRLKFALPRANNRQLAASHPSTLFGYNVDLGETGLGICVRPQLPWLTTIESEVA
jgi:hypothetical protein